MERICSIHLSSSSISSALAIMSHPSNLLVGMVVAAAAVVVEVAGSLDLAMSAHPTIQQQEAAVVAVVALRGVITGVVADVGWGIAKGIPGRAIGNFHSGTSVLCHNWRRSASASRREIGTKS